MVNDRPPVFIYGPEAVEHLSRRDPLLGAHIARIGPMERETTPDLFESLVGSIVSQQISGKAAVTVGNRLMELLGGECTPERVIDADPLAIQACGMSHRKVSYIKSAAQAARDGSLPLAGLASMTDEELVKCLDALPGIGRWTAEMLMIFSLNRHDILSYDDLGIRRGLMRVHSLESISRKEFEHFRTLYSPYGSVASLYLWHVAGE